MLHGPRNAYLLVAVITLITVNLWVLSKPAGFSFVLDPLRSLSQILALLGFVYISTGLVLTAKIRVVDRWLLGLDKAVWLHRSLNTASFLFILHHPLLLAIGAIPQWPVVKLYLIPSSNLAYTLGIASLYTFILGLICIVFIKLPYNWWKWTHRLLGFAFLSAGLHTLLIGSDIAAFLPLKLWIGLFIILGSLAFFNTLYQALLKPGFLYVIDKIQIEQGIVTLYLESLAQPLVYRPGQFTYLTVFDSQVSRESHPFSLASSPTDPFVRLGVKADGDYTHRLIHLQSGRRVTLSESHGLFGEPYLQAAPTDTFIWIAGGIGITPFLGLVRYAHQHSQPQPVNLYYCVTHPEEAVFDGELSELTASGPVRYQLWASAVKKRRLTAADTLAAHPNPFRINVMLCGSPRMMNDLTRQFLDAGVPHAQIYFEQFDFGL